MHSSKPGSPIFQANVEVPRLETLVPFVGAKEEEYSCVAFGSSYFYFSEFVLVIMHPNTEDVAVGQLHSLVLPTLLSRSPVI